MISHTKSGKAYLPAAQIAASVPHRVDRPPAGELTGPQPPDAGCGICGIVERLVRWASPPGK
ncbi:MAG TPA: hypothetical protein VEH31_32180, partial [Streptosporangiaceae bacterium]|nr:hypothetical protein [Streptosporangiaceae bacterium]